MKRWIAVLLVIAVAGAGWWAYQNRSRKSRIEVLETDRAALADIRDVLVATGIIKPQVGAVVKIGARATGEIHDMPVKVGDEVQPGDLVARIDDREIQKALAGERAALEAARSTLDQVETTFPERIREARARLEFARVDYAREKALIEQEFTTQDAVDRAKSEFEAADATLKALLDEYRTEREIAKARIEEIEAQIAQQEIRLSYTRVLAPIGGVVTEVTAQKGETIVTGLQVANLVTVMDPTLLEMQIYVDETDVGRVRPGFSVEYSVDTHPGRVFHGVIEKIYTQPTVRDNIVYYLAIVKVPKEDALMLRPEMTTYCKIILSRKEGVLTVSNAAVKYENGRQVVYRVLGPGSVEKQEVTVGVRGEDRTEILSGVKEGDTVATRLVLPSSAPGRR